MKINNKEYIKVCDPKAREWGAKWLDTENYIRLFGEPSE